MKAPVVFILFSLSAGPIAHAGSSSSESFEPVRTCLARMQEDIDKKTLTSQSTQFRGNLMLLNQRTRSAACWTPKNDVIAWARPAAGGDSSEITFFYPNSSGKMTLRRYQISNKEMRSQNYLELPDSDFDCGKGLLPTGGSGISVVHESVRVRLESFPTQFDAKLKPDWKLGDPPRLYKMENIDKDSEHTLSYGGAAKELPIPSWDEAMSEMLTQMTHHWVHMEDRALAINTPSREFTSRMTELIRSCREAQKVLDSAPGEKTPRRNDASARLRRALDDAESIFVSPVPGRRTIKDFDGSDSSSSGAR